jgi:hypothetical protein
MSTTPREPRVSEPVKPAGVSQDFPEFPIGENGKAVNQPVNQAAPQGAGALTEQQRTALTLIVAGQALTEVAEAVGVDRRTIYNWRHHHDAFRDELERRRVDLWEETADRIRALLEPAVRMLQEQIQSRYDQHRYRAARTILRLAKVGPTIPVKQKG